MSFIKKLIKATKNDLATIAEDGVIGDVHGFIDTGSYTLNALLSGSIFNGFAEGKVTGLAAEQACGKTFILLSAAKNFLDADPKNIVVYYDSEAAISKSLLINMGIPLDRFILVPVNTIEEFRKSVFSVLDEYKATPQDEKGKLFLCLDSLGMLSSNKEVNDIADGKDTRDMTKAQLIKGTFRAITLRLGELRVAMAVTAHTYDSMGAMFPTKEVAGGKGLLYAASTIVMFGKRKEKDGSEQIGVNIRAKMYKSRFTIEGSEHYFVLDFGKGMQKYSGLVDLALEGGIWSQLSKRIELPDGSKVFESKIYKEPENYFTKEVLDEIDAFAKTKYSYSSNKDDVAIDEDDTLTEYLDDVSDEQL